MAVTTSIKIGCPSEPAHVSAPSNCAIARFSTDDLPEECRIAAWREHYGRSVLRVDVEPGGNAAFAAAVASATLPGLQVISVMLTAARIMRTHKLIEDGNDDLFLLVNQAGHASVSARGREVTLCENDAVLLSCGEPITVERRSPGNSISFRIPYLILSPLIVDAEDAVMHLIPARTAALTLLTSYASALLDDEHALATPALRRHVVTHVHDLVALTIGATRDAADIARGGAGASRLRAAKIYIIENIGRRGISVGSVASHLGMTPRCLQRLFENDGTTFSAFLLGRRLARAHRMLFEPQTVQKRVSAIAYDVGFGDLSYFNRCFRRLYGATPLDIREAAVKWNLADE